MKYGMVVAGLVLLITLQSVAGQVVDERAREQLSADQVNTLSSTEQQTTEDRKGSLPESQYQEQTGPNTMDLSSDFSM
ncbi:hypothetical protein [Methylophilus methylotrophus]|uniref:hypothetical protein n=1 Tax=Methylophilus methylotrophus TaxID=17 RepID=UPI0012B655B9|nr:hypothetical protein [Methylophilus methylotrophus]